MVKRMEPYSDEWERAANRVARDFVEVRHCVECGGPHVKGYCCTRCGSTCPEGGCDEE